MEDRGCILDDGVYDASLINYTVVWQEKQVGVCSSSAVVKLLGLVSHLHISLLGVDSESIRGSKGTLESDP